MATRKPTYIDFASGEVRDFDTGDTIDPIVATNVSGGGDMLKSENLSGLSNYTTARSNMGLVIGTNVQAQNTNLQNVADIEPSEDDIIQYKTGSFVNRSISQLKTDLALFSGFAKITVGTVTPTSPATGDLWVDTN